MKKNMQKIGASDIIAHIFDLYKKNKSFVRFVVVGSINTAVDFSTFAGLKSFLHLDPYISQIIAYGVGVTNSFVLNKLWTFEAKKSNASTSGQLVRFVCINAVSLGISLLGLKFLNKEMGLNIYLSKLLVTVIAQAVNYFGYKLWVFNSSK